MTGISILVATYARTALLAETVESFKRQTWTGPKELVILNDCPSQQLVCNVPGVRVINHPTAIEHYHTKRNKLLEEAHFPWLALWDDDDVYMPEFLVSAHQKLQAGDKAARTSRIMRARGSIHGRELTSILRGDMYHTAVINTEALRAVVGFPQTEKTDADLVKRMVQYRFFHGRHHHVPDTIRPQMVYRVDDERPQMEGNGSRISSKEFRRRQNERVHGRFEPSGVVNIVPAWSRDWSAFVDAHWNSPKDHKPRKVEV